MDNLFKGHFHRKGLAKTTHSTKILEFPENTDFLTLEIDIDEKRPRLGKNVTAKSNVRVLDPISTQNDPETNIDSMRKTQMLYIKQTIRHSVEKLMAKHGLNDADWIKAPSSQLFLSYIAKSLILTESEEHEDLLNAFFKFFTPRADDSLKIIQERVAITPRKQRKYISICLERMNLIRITEFLKKL
ncbi:hypothetical protein CKA38_03235 [Ereboglobus luteus]|uniref:Uncharacterized protein n=2 Tax=Ereboglobus luteus TaxID=1796921 RepID=A0A2U8E0N8_9BACT|nr:hypothetical protein CKA38_03235 [Ereboglobus luteus]